MWHFCTSRAQAWSSHTTLFFVTTTGHRRKKLNIKYFLSTEYPREQNKAGFCYFVHSLYRRQGPMQPGIIVIIILASSMRLLFRSVHKNLVNCWNSFLMRPHEVLLHAGPPPPSTTPLFCWPAKIYIFNNDSDSDSLNILVSARCFV